MLESMEALARCPLFDGVAEGDIRAMLGCMGAKTVSVERGETVFFEDSPAEYVGIMLSGAAQVQRGDFLQMTGNYGSGSGAHSAIMIADYDPESDTVRWMDSNMRGRKRNGIRYGIVQFDREIGIDWWAKAFCHKKRGATLYRLRDDLIFAEDAQ